MILNVNGKAVTVTAGATTPLLWVLREQLGLVGTKYGCGSQVCGSCTVLVDGVAKKTCNLRIGTIDPASTITTIEGLSPTGTHPLQQAWIAQQVPQCGYCQSGMIMSAAGLLATTPQPTDDDIDAAIDNICVCGTYQRIRAAIHQAAGS